MKLSTNTNLKSNESNQTLSENTIWLIMTIISLIHGLICISPGIISSCVTEIKKDFHLSDQKFGSLGTIYGFGSLIGSLIFIIVIEITNHKHLICGMIITNCLCNFVFFFNIKYSTLLISRFISGFASVFCFIYFPIWVEKFAMEKWENFMQTTVQVANTLGNIIGYFIYLILGSEKYKYGFFIESFSILILVVIMILIPNKYYDKNYRKQKETQEVIITDSLENKEKPSNNIIDNTDKKANKKESIIKDIICNIPFILITLYRGNRVFIFVAINFWFSDYLQNSLLEKNPNIIFWSYSITMVISSLLGNILGGIIINKIGGTKSKYSFISMSILQFLSVMFGLFSPLTYSVFYFTILMSLYILINSASGIISISATFSVIPEDLTGIANGIYSLVVNLIGFLPAPYTYAFLKKIFKKDGTIIVALMIYGFIGCLELIIADYYMRVKKIKLYKQKFFSFKGENIKK